MTLAPDELMAAAEAETGLTDYGSDSFRPGLEHLTEALRSEAQLNELGSDICACVWSGTWPVDCRSTTP